MLKEDPQSLFDLFVTQTRDYLDSPGVMAALELDKTCMMLYPVIARTLDNRPLSNMVRDFGRGLPRKEADELQELLHAILAKAKAAGLTIPD
ncbi:hypothetical protein [Thiolapillus sp.]